MAADMHIHVLKDVTEKQIQCMNSSCISSKWFDWDYECELCGRDIFTNSCALQIEQNSPSIWLGRVSWLKASLLEDNSYVPGPLFKIEEIIGEDLPMIDKDLIEKIEQAFEIPNDTSYRMAEKEHIIQFLKSYVGERVFTISW